MLGLLFIFFIAKYYYTLAKTYHKNRWGFLILGIATYYGSGIFFSFLIGFLLELFAPGLIDGWPTIVFGLVIVVFGSYSAYTLYHFLKKRWKNEFNYNQSKEYFNLE